MLRRDVLWRGSICVTNDCEPKDDGKERKMIIPSRNEQKFKGPWIYFPGRKKESKASLIMSACETVRSCVPFSTVTSVESGTNSWI